MKETISTIFGAVCSFIASLFGGFDVGLQTLLIFMIVDFLTGILCAGFFKKSTKTDNGGLSSNECFKGLLKKGVALLVVLVACRLDMIIGSTLIRDTVIFGFLFSEGLSIIENAALMGIPIPEVVTKALEVINRKSNAFEDDGESQKKVKKEAGENEAEQRTDDDKNQ